MNVLVTGGTGFLGQRLALRLLAERHQVTVLGRNEGIGHTLEAQGIRFVRADLGDAERVSEACRDQEVVFHSGALSSPWGRYEDFHRANVLGTRHVTQGCQAHGVRRLVHVSTPSVYFDFSDRHQVAETDPLPTKSVNAYAATKLMAEGIVDEAHRQGLETITFRPRALFGPGDTTILPRLIRANRKGSLPLFGKESPLIDITYVDNVVDALLLGRDARPEALGRKYNITNGEPVRLHDILEKLFARLEMPYQPRPVPYALAYGLAGTMELVSRTLLGGKEPLLTRYSVGVLAKSQTLDISAAREMLGYEPRVSVDEGLEAFVAWWKECNA